MEKVVHEFVNKQVLPSSDSSAAAGSADRYGQSFEQMDIVRFCLITTSKDGPDTLFVF